MRRNTYLTDAEHREIVEKYQAGSTQVELAEVFQVTQVRVSQLLKKYGVPTRQNREANPVTFDVDRAELLYSTGLTGAAVGEVLGISPSVILTHLRERGVTRPTGSVRKYSGYDKGFFREANPVSTYWAGFIAADGCVYRNRLLIGLHPDDEDMIQKFKAAAKLPHPIVKRRNGSGKEYVYLEVCCDEWVADLARTFNITPRKSLTLQPPEGLSEELQLTYVRGYFDGDGHASKDGTKIHFTCGSLTFLEWVVRQVLKSPHKIYPYSNSVASGCYISGECAREAVSRLYAGSTPETRMDRKYQRLLPIIGDKLVPSTRDGVG